MVEIKKRALARSVVLLVEYKFISFHSLSLPQFQDLIM